MKWTRTRSLLNSKSRTHASSDFARGHDIDSWLLERYKQSRPPMRVVAARRPEDLASLVERRACDVLIAVTTREAKALEAVPKGC